MLVEIKTDGKPLRFCRPIQAVVADGDRRDRGKYKQHPNWTM
jgi:hypothetical protein